MRFLSQFSIYSKPSREISEISFIKKWFVQAIPKHFMTSPGSKYGEFYNSVHGKDIHIK